MQDFVHQPYDKRSCCKSTKELQIPVTLHLRNRATPFRACCLPAYLQLGSARVKMLESMVWHHSKKEHIRKLEVLSWGRAEYDWKTSRNPWVSWCIRKRGPNSLVFAALRTLRQNSRTPIVVVFCCVSVERSWFLVLMPERKHAKTRGFVVCECREVFQYIKENHAFHGIFATDEQTRWYVQYFVHRENDRNYRQSWFLAVWEFRV